LLRFDGAARRSEHVGGIVQRERHVPRATTIGIDAKVVEFAIWIVGHLGKKVPVVKITNRGRKKKRATEKKKEAETSRETVPYTDN